MLNQGVFMLQNSSLYGGLKEGLATHVATSKMGQKPVARKVAVAPKAVASKAAVSKDADSKAVASKAAAPKAAVSKPTTSKRQPFSTMSPADY